MNPFIALTESLRGVEDKRLTHGILWSDRDLCACALGNLIPPAALATIRRSSYRSGSLNNYIEGHSGSTADALRQWVRDSGLNSEGVRFIEAINDTDPLVTPRERYVRVLAEFARLSELSEEALKGEMTRGGST